MRPAWRTVGHDASSLADLWLDLTLSPPMILFGVRERERARARACMRDCVHVCVCVCVSECVCVCVIYICMSAAQLRDSRNVSCWTTRAYNTMQQGHFMHTARTESGCIHMLTYANVCERMRTYAALCCIHMLTYANVYRRASSMRTAYSACKGEREI